MPIRRNKQWKQTEAAIERGIQNVVAKAVVLLQRDLKLKLSEPGMGRFYARHKKVKGLSTRPHGELNIAQVAALMNKEAARVARNPKAKMRNLRGLGVHRASAPGQPPAVDTGMLRRSMQIDVSRLKERNPRGRVGTNVNYAKGLEYGTRKVRPRPYFRPVARKARKKIVEQFKAAGLIVKGIR